jgi:hypothetical protein
MSFYDKKLTPQPWYAGEGCIVGATENDGSFPSSEDMAYYGGALVCESMCPADAQFAVIAIRQREILWRALHDIGECANEETRAHARRAWALCYDTEEEVRGPDAMRLKVIKAVFSYAHYSHRYNWFAQLPETATRARIEPTGFCYWPSGRFVTDNIELWSTYPTSNTFSNWSGLAKKFEENFLDFEMPF